MSKPLTAADILGTDDLKRELVEVPEWGGHIYIRTMTGTERDAFEASCLNVSASGKSKPPNLANFRARFIAQVACDESGAILFTAAQVKELGDKSASALNRCFSVAQRLSGLSDDDVEELVKN